MTKLPSLSKQLALLLIVLVLKLSLDFTQSATDARRLFDNDDDSMLEENSDEQQQLRADSLQKLRHFLLTSDAEQRASKRQQVDSSKRNLVSGEARTIDWRILLLLLDTRISSFVGKL